MIVIGYLFSDETLKPAYGGLMNLPGVAGTCFEMFVSALGVLGTCLKVVGFLGVPGTCLELIEPCLGVVCPFLKSP